MIGANCVLTAAGATIGKAQDVELDLESEPQENTTRDGDGWKTYEQGLKGGTINTKQLWVPTNAGLIALRQAFFSGGAIAWQDIDSDGEGFSGQAIVNGLSSPRPIGGTVQCDIKLTITGAVVVVGTQS